MQIAIQTSLIPVKLGLWGVKKTYQVFMMPFELFFSWINIFVPVNEAVTASTDAVKDLTNNSMFAMTSLLAK